MNDAWTKLERLTPKEVAAFPEVKPRQIRTWARDSPLVILENPADGKRLVPREFLVKGEDYVGPLETLKSTITLLRDCGLTDTEIVGRLFLVEETLGRTPLQALLTRKKEAVRRTAGALAL